MNRIGILKIGFKEQNEVDDVWVQQEFPAQRDMSSFHVDGSHWFKSIDQGNTSIIEDLKLDESGKCYEIELSFVVRTEEDMEMAKKYAGRPVVVYAIAVDGRRYAIGTKSYPAYIVISNKYDALNSREVSLDVSYQSKTSLLR